MGLRVQSGGSADRASGGEADATSNLIIAPTNGDEGIQISQSRYSILDFHRYDIRRVRLGTGPDGKITTTLVSSDPAKVADMSTVITDQMRQSK